MRAALLFFAALSACSQDGPVPIVRGTDGGVDASCPVDSCSPYACDRHFGRCFTVCRSSSDCAADFVCDRGACVGTDCTVETAPERCAGYSCVGGKCSRDCTSAVCSEGFYCRGDTKQCVRRCTSRDDAVCGGFVCDVTVGECEPYCFAGEIECAKGYACTAEMRCEPVADAG